MKLIMLLLVRDEADIVAQNIEFHLDQGVDFVVAVDNGSVDGTRDLLDEFERTGHAKVFDEPGRDYAQGRWVTRAMEYARDTLGADWIFSNDADEFWLPREGTLRDMLVVPGASLLSCNRFNMVFPWDAPGSSSWCDRMTYRIAQPVPRPSVNDIYNDVLPCPYFYLDLPPKVMMRAEGLVSIAQGNHLAVYSSAVQTAPAPLDIYHFPIRSEEQFRKKIIQGGQAYAANTELPETAGWHWRRWYKAYQNLGIEAPLADALPDQQRLQADLKTGQIIRDDHFVRQVSARSFSWA